MSAPDVAKICTPCWMDDCFSCDGDGCHCACESEQSDDDDFVDECLAEVVPLGRGPSGGP